MTARVIGWVVGAQGHLAAWLAGSPLLAQESRSGGVILLTLLAAGLLVPALFFLMRSLVGPVLFYDLMRIGRQRRYFLLRFLCIAGLGAIFIWMYVLWSIERRYRSGSSGPSIQDMAELAQWLFYTFVYVEFFLVGLLTPAYTAGAIADEKDRKTLEFMLATDLRNREIVLSKLLARVLNMLMLVLAGLPILSFAQFFGGIEPDLLAACMAALVITTLSLSSLGILTSVYSKKARDAIVLTYLGAAVYLGLTLLLWALASTAGGRWADWPSTDDWTSPVTVHDLIDWLSTGNLFVAFIELGRSWRTGQSLPDFLPGILSGYAIFHGVVVLVCCLWAVVRIRAVALKEVEVKGGGRFAKVWIGLSMIGLLLLPGVGWLILLYWRPWRLFKASARPRWIGSRPAVGKWPMLWKETVAEPGLRFNWMGRIIILLLLIACFVPGVWILIDFFINLTDPEAYRGRFSSGNFVNRYDLWTELGWEMNIWVRWTSTLVCCLMLLGVAVRAAGSISGERDKQTLDALLTSPLSCNDILFGKWLGSILSVRLAWIWLAVVWALGVLTGGLHIVGLGLVILAWLVYAAVFASVGMWCSASSRTSLRATIWTLFFVISLSVGHWLVMALFCFMPLAFVGRSSGSSDIVEFLAKFEFGQTPPAVLAFLAFHGDEFSETSKEITHLTLSSVFGIISWSVLALVLWHLASQRFRSACGRDPVQLLRLGGPARWSVPVAARPTPVALPIAEDPSAEVTDIQLPGLRGALLIEEVLPDEDDPKRPS